MTNFQELTRAVQHLHTLAPEVFAPITDDESLGRATAVLRGMDMEMGEDPAHPLRQVADQLMHKIVAYEAIHYPVPDSDGASTLKFMLEQHQVTQQQLADATGIKQETISALLSRKRKITADHARKLAGYFKVGVGAFL